MNFAFDFNWSEWFGTSAYSWETIGFVTGIFSVLLLLFTKHGVIQWLAWPFGAINAVAYFILFREWTLYGNMALQVPFLVLSLLGAMTWIGQLGIPWKNVTLERIRAIPTTYASTYHWWTAYSLGLIAFIPAYFILGHYGDASPFWDGLILTISLSALYLQLRKYVQTWYLWILVDLIAVPFHFSQDRDATALLYFIFLIMCVFGYIEWRKATQPIERQFVVGEGPRELEDYWLMP